MYEVRGKDGTLIKLDWWQLGIMSFLNNIPSESYHSSEPKHFLKGLVENGVYNSALFTQRWTS